MWAHAQFFMLGRRGPALGTPETKPPIRLKGSYLKPATADLAKTAHIYFTNDLEHCPYVENLATLYNNGQPVLQFLSKFC